MSYSNLIKRREIKKVVDNRETNNPSPVISDKKLNKATYTGITPSETENKRFIKDVIETAEGASEQVSKIIKEIQSKNSVDPIFNIYYSTLNKYFNPKDLLKGKTPSNDYPPSNALKIVERDIYRRQTDPRVILLGDMVKINNQIGAVEYAYKDGYDSLFSSSGISNSSNSKPLSKLLFQKDIQLIQNGLNYVNKFNNLGHSNIDEDYLNGISEMLYRYTGDLTTLGNQLSHLSLVHIDNLFDEFYNLSISIDNIIGNINQFAVGKRKTAFNASKLFGMADTVFDALKDLEHIGNPSKPSQKLLDIKEGINQTLFASLGSVESELLSTEGKLLQTDEARQHMLKNVELSNTVKEFSYVISSLSSLGDSINRFGNSPNVIYDVTTILKSNSNLQSSIKSFIEKGRSKQTTKNTDSKTELAAIVLTEWGEGV